MKDVDYKSAKATYLKYENELNESYRHGVKVRLITAVVLIASGIIVFLIGSHAGNFTATMVGIVLMACTVAVWIQALNALSGKRKLDDLYARLHQDQLTEDERKKIIKTAPSLNEREEKKAKKEADREAEKAERRAERGSKN